MFLLNVASVVSVIVTLGQPTAASLTLQTWGVPQGLPDLSVRDIAQTPDGRVWVATDRGVAWVDGAPPTPMRMQSGFEELREMLTLAVDGQGTLWMAPTRGEPICLRAGHLEECLPEGHRITNQVQIVDVQPDTSGRIWLATDDLVYVFAGGQLSWLSSFPDEVTGKVRGVHIDEKGRVWIAGARGLFYRDQDGEVRAHPIPGESAPEITALSGGRNGAVWAAGRGFVLRIAGDGQRVVREADGLPRVPFAAILEGRDGSLWLASAEGLVRWQPADQQPWRTLTRRNDGLPADDLTALFEDREGHLWIGTRGAGIARITLPGSGIPTDSGGGRRLWRYGLILLFLFLGLVLVAGLASWRRVRHRSQP